MAAAPTKATPARVTSMTFSTSGELLVGWSDGKLGTIDITKKRGKLKTLDRKKHAVVAISPDGKSAVLDAQPVTIVETHKGLHLAEASQITKFEGAAFTQDGEHLLVSGKDRILVWKDARELDRLGKKGVRLEEFIARQNGDYSAQLGAMDAQMAVLAEGPRVLFSDADGLLTLWDMRNKTEAEYIAKIAPPHAVRTLHDDLALIASASNRELHVFRYEDGKKSSWNKTVKADDAIGTPAGIAVLDAGVLTLRGTQAGDVLWQATLEETGSACGMSYGFKNAKKATGPRLAVCLNDQITVHDLDTGEVLSTFVRKKTKVVYVKTKKKKTS